MLKEKNDITRLESLICSLKIWSRVTHNAFSHYEYEKDTGSLYRFGWFNINGYKYSVSGWKFKEGIVTFENEDTGEKIKYDIMLSRPVNGGHFTKDDFFTGNIKKLRIKVSIWLRKLSDKLQP